MGLNLIVHYGQIRRRADHLRRRGRALARPPSQDTLQVHPCSSVAASMPPRVPRRWAGKDQSCWSVCRAISRATSKPCDAVSSLFSKTTSQPSGVVSSPIAGPCGGMDAATEPPRTDSRRVPRAVRAPRLRPDVKIAKRSRYAQCRRLDLIAQDVQIRRRADHLRRCCRALARPPSQDTLQVRPCKLRGGIHAAKGPATVGGQGPVAMVGPHGYKPATIRLAMR
ncbi:hypothetical protein FHR48_001335 [Xanthomonas arboricola]|nr:hypothetical protein [Xanthomonas cannabis]